MTTETVIVEVSEERVTAAIRAIEDVLIGADETDAQAEAADHALRYLDTVTAHLAAENNRLHAQLTQWQRKDMAYEAEFKRIEAIAVKKADKDARYEVFPPDLNVICPVCGNHPRLLCPADWQPALPAFYVCSCGNIGQIGVGAVIRAGRLTRDANGT